jgi:hypothetical protein
VKELASKVKLKCTIPANVADLSARFSALGLTSDGRFDESSFGMNLAF